MFTLSFLLLSGFYGNMIQKFRTKNVKKTDMFLSSKKLHSAHPERFKESFYKLFFSCI